MQKLILVVLTFSLLFAFHSEVKAQEFELDLSKGFEKVSIGKFEITYYKLLQGLTFAPKVELTEGEVIELEIFSDSIEFQEVSVIPTSGGRYLTIHTKNYTLGMQNSSIVGMSIREKSIMLKLKKLDQEFSLWPNSYAKREGLKKISISLHLEAYKTYKINL